ncbi:hypothetical protein EV424DRAFT_1542928 [Suillus variegatus]|nr:hypothetical protein EV424DRAFT_1542928 [Suillus variegatus]
MHQGISVVTWFRLSRNHPIATVQYDNSGASAISKLHPQPGADETTLAELGYKQEFYREFTPLEVGGLAFSFVGVAPSIASVLFYAISNGGPFAMVWGWAFACPFIMCIGMALAELASAAPTSGGLYYWTYSLVSPRCRNFLSWIVGYSNAIGISQESLP